MLCLEGGYQTSQTSKSVEACLRSLLEPRPAEEEEEEEGKEDREEEVAIEIKQLVSEVKQTQSAYWSFK
jgi:acetoin utilization deacetylase AcuC-like enzyme